MYGDPNRLSDVDVGSQTGFERGKVRLPVGTMVECGRHSSNLALPRLLLVNSLDIQYTSTIFLVIEQL